jgi:hypothetical protein
VQTVFLVANDKEESAKEAENSMPGISVMPLLMQQIFASSIHAIES